jgi:hypothetical protein
MNKDLENRIKRMMNYGCKHTGRCKSHKVNEDLCPVCHNGMYIIEQLRNQK